MTMKMMKGMMMKTEPNDSRLKIQIEPCCNDMADAIMMNDFRQGIIQDDDGVFIWWDDCDTMPLRFCPSCGKKIVMVKR